MEIIGGYALIKKDATKFITSGELTDFQNKCVRVFEFAEDGGALCVNNKATHMAMIEKEEIAASFKCIEYANVLCPPNMKSTLDQMMYYSKVVSRKGGYNYLCKEMVIAASLHRGEFTDSVLFQK